LQQVSSHGFKVEKYLSTMLVIPQQAFSSSSSSDHTRTADNPPIGLAAYVIAATSLQEGNIPAFPQLIEYIQVGC
jgi:hypothetical protein